MKDSRKVALNIPVKDSTLVAEKESLQQLVCVRFHKHCVHLSILRGKVGSIKHKWKEQTFGTFVSMYFLRSIVRNSKMR